MSLRKIKHVNNIMKSTVLLTLITLSALGCATTKNSDFEKRFNDSIYSYTSLLSDMIDSVKPSEDGVYTEEQINFVSQYECVIALRSSKHFQFIIDNLDEYNAHLGSNDTKESVIELLDDRMLDYETQKKALEAKGIPCEIPTK